MDEQAQEMVEMMKALDTIDFVRDWKLVTMYIGGNDQCLYFEDPYIGYTEVYNITVTRV